MSRAEKGLIVTALLLAPACLTAASIYNYEAVGTNAGSSACSSQTYSDIELSVQNCAVQQGVTVSADAIATYSDLHVDSTIVFSNALLSTGLIASGYARTADMLTVDPSSGVALLSFAFHIDGSWSDNGVSLVKPALSFGFNYGESVSPALPVQYSVSSTGSGFVDTIFNTPFYPVADFQLYPYFFSLTSQEIENAPTSPAYVSASAAVNFLQTASVAYITPLDAGGAYLPNAVVGSLGSGATFAVANIPEPAPFTPVLCSLLFIVAGVAWFRPRVSAR